MIPVEDTPEKAHKKMIAPSHPIDMSKELSDCRSVEPPPKPTKKTAIYSKHGQDTICKSLEMTGDANFEFTEQERLMMQHKKHLEAPFKDSVRIRDTSSATVDTSWKVKPPKDTFGIQSKEKQPVIHNKPTFKSEIFDDKTVPPPRRQKHFVQAPSTKEKDPHPSKKSFENHSFLSETIQNKDAYSHVRDSRPAKKAVDIEVKEKPERHAKKMVPAPSDNKTAEIRPAKKMQPNGASAFQPTNNIFDFTPPERSRNAKRPVLQPRGGQLNLFA